MTRARRFADGAVEFLVPACLIVLVLVPEPEPVPVPV